MSLLRIAAYTVAETLSAFHSPDNPKRLSLPVGDVDPI